MSSPDNPLDALMKLAQSRSGTDRTLLYRHVAHLLMQKGISAKQANARILFELFDALSGQVDIDTRAEFARDLARSHHAPPALLLRVAKDDIEAAAHVLRNSEFSEAALLDIIKSTTRAHHLVIAERRDLTQKLWQAIVERRETAPPGPPAPPPEALRKEPQTTHQPQADDTASAPGLIPFKNRARGDADMFVPGNDTEPAPTAKPKKQENSSESTITLGDADDTIGGALANEPIPAFFLEKPKQRGTVRPGRVIAPGEPKTKAKAQPTTAAPKLSTDTAPGSDGRNAPPVPLQEKAAKFTIDRSGTINKSSTTLANLLGKEKGAISRQHFLDVIPIEDKEAEANLLATMRKHLPVRGVSVTLPKGAKASRAKLDGVARFEHITGRFTGYECSLLTEGARTGGCPEPTLQSPATVTSLPTSGAPSKSSASKTEASTSAAPGHVLAAHLSADASLPIQDMLAGIQRIARAARRTNDQAMLTDIRAVMADCFRLRDMIQDADRIARMFGTNAPQQAEEFDVFKIINAVLDDDLTRHDGTARFQLNPGADFTYVRFSRQILSQALSRMVEIARESAGHGDILRIDVVNPNESELEIALPLGADGNKRSSDAELLEPDDQLKLASMRREREGTPVMTARLGLSAIQDSIESLGGRLDIDLLPGMTGGQVSIILPLA